MFIMNRPVGAPAATITKNVVESVRVTAPPLPTLLSSPESQRKRSSSGVPYRAKFTSHNNSIFERSAAPMSVMYHVNGSWVNFPDDIVEALRTGFLDRKPMIEMSIDGAKYVFHLKLMLQFDFLTGYYRSISWIDEKGMRFFPVGFPADEEDTGDRNYKGDNISSNDKGDKNNCIPKIEVEVNIDRNSSKRKLREEPEVTSSNRAVGVDFVKRQRLEERGVAKWPNTRLARATERVYLLVEDHFYTGIRKVDAGATITSIHQCERDGHLFKARLEVFQKQVEITKAARGTSNIVYAWYGASAGGIRSVMAHGFGLPSKVPANEVYGVGMYLSPVGLPHLSANLADFDDNGVKHLILCRVVLGNVEKVEVGSQQYHPTNRDFDTGSDDPKNPKWFVVWSTIANMHILPKCVVSFRPGNMQAPGRPVPGVRYSVEKFFSKIKSYMPPAKVREIMISYSTLKAGKLSKDGFLKKMRVVVGDEVLKSVIQDISASQ